MFIYGKKNLLTYDEYLKQLCQPSFMQELDNTTAYSISFDKNL